MYYYTHAYLQLHPTIICKYIYDYTGLHVCLLLCNTTFVGNNVLKRVIHKPAVAALVTVRLGAIDEVLFAQADQLPRFIEPLPLHRTRSRERPNNV